MDPGLASQEYCYLTTRGRRSGQPREIEIWFALRGVTAFMLAGGRERAHWVRNLMADPGVTIRIAGQTFAATARVLAPGTAEDAAARDLLVAKYGGGSSGDLSGWGRSALAVAFDLDAEP